MNNDIKENDKVKHELRYFKETLKPFIKFT